MVRNFLFGCLICLVGFLAACVVTFAHEAPSGWTYPLMCCSNTDCRQIDQTAVRTTVPGYVVPSGEVISFTDKRIRESPDGEWHWCTVGGTPKGKTICLFVPPNSY